MNDEYWILNNTNKNPLTCVNGFLFVFTAQKGNNSKEFLKSGASVPPSLTHFSLLLITFQKSTRRLVKSE